MTSARANLDSDRRPQRTHHAPLRSGLHAVAGGAEASEVVPIGGPVLRQRLLRALVERFGGEVTVSALTRYLSHEPGWTAPASGPKLTDILRALQGLGAVDLEPNGEHDMIVRILPEGAALYN